MNSLGAIKKMRYVAHHEIAIKPWENTITKSEVEKLEWEEVKFVFQSSDFDQTNKESSAGDYYPTKIQCEVADQNSEHLRKAGQFFALWITDHNGNDYLVGRSQTPLKLTVPQNVIPARITSRAGVTLLFEGGQLTPPILIIP